MMKASVAVLAALSCLTLAAPAMARHVHHHADHRHGGYRHVPPGVIPDVLVANPYGDVIISGKTGFHRSDLGVMVPDSEPGSFVATGRASGSGLGANGLPGSNFQ